VADLAGLGRLDIRRHAAGNDHAGRRSWARSRPSTRA
jgi:hypothetical protein